MTGLAVIEPPAQAQTQAPAQCRQIVRELGLDLQQVLTRKGRAPFVLSGLPMFEDLWAYRQALAQCLALADEPHLRHWYTVLDRILPLYQSAFAEVGLALNWVKDIKQVLAVLPSTTEASAPDGNTVAGQLAHYLGQLADISELSPWLTQFRHDLLAVSERYWSGLFHCYDIEGLPPTNNDHESLYGQIKRQLRRRLGVHQLRQPLLRRGAWTVFQIDAASPTELKERLALVSWHDYALERARYQHRQAQFHRRYRWRHQRDTVLQQRVAAWTVPVSDC